MPSLPVKVWTIPRVAVDGRFVAVGGKGVRVGGADVAVGGARVFVGIALCVSASPVLTVEMAVSMISASLSVGVDRELLQEVSKIVARNKQTRLLPRMFMLHLPLIFYL